MLRNQLWARVTTRLLSTSEKGATMASKNVETLRAAHESWNRRDFAGVVRNSAENLAYTDNARSLNLNGPDKFREWTEAWAHTTARRSSLRCGSLVNHQQHKRRAPARLFERCRCSIP